MGGTNARCCVGVMARLAWYVGPEYCGKLETEVWYSEPSCVPLRRGEVNRFCLGVMPDLVSLSKLLQCSVFITLHQVQLHFLGQLCNSSFMLMHFKSVSGVPLLHFLLKTNWSHSSQRNAAFLTWLELLS